MTGIEQGLFPREDKRDDDLEEERRLFYVGATRAMDELYLTSCAMRRVFGSVKAAEPSLFLREADPAAFRVIGNAPPGFVLSRSGGKGAGPETFRGFVPSRSGRKGAGPKPSRRSGNPPPVSSDGRWRRGNRVFHDDYGYGAVAEIRESDEGPVVRVCFETGKEIRFLSLVQSAKFMKVEDDG
jgi:DNA helicase-2/ATP-dependent DNA helicase PcrA